MASRSLPCAHDAFLRGNYTPFRIHGPLRSSQYHEAHFYDLRDAIEDDVTEALLNRHGSLLREARIVFQTPFDVGITSCHMLLRFWEDRVVKYCDLDGREQHKDEPWNVDALQKQEWEAERAGFYAAGQRGLIVLGINEDASAAAIDGDNDEAQELHVTVITSTDPQHPLAKPNRTIPGDIDSWALASPTMEVFKARIGHKHPEFLDTRFLEIVKYAEDTYRWRSPVSEPLPPWPGTGGENLPRRLGEWRDVVLRASDNSNGQPKKSLCIVGPPNTAKTVWARSLGRHIFCSTKYRLYELRSAFEADYVIFYNIDIRFLPWKKFVNHMEQQQQQQPSVVRIWGPYEPAEYIQWSPIPVIFIYNEDPNLGDLRASWDDCVETVKISDPLYVRE